MTRRDQAATGRHRRQIARTQPDCGICGYPIDYSLGWLHPEAFTVDHIMPLAKGGKDVLENKQAAHRKCNRSKSDHVDDSRLFVTERVW